MPPVPKKNRCVILFDLLSENKMLLYKALLKIHTYKYFHPKKDEFHLILVNSRKTSNRMNQKHKMQFLHLNEINCADIYDPKEIYRVMNSETNLTSDKCADLIEALTLAQGILKENFKHFIVTNQVLVLSDLNNLTQSALEPFPLIEELKILNTYVYFIGINVNFNVPISDSNQIENFMKKIDVPEKINLAKVLLKNGVKGVISNISHGIPLFLSYKNKKGTQAWYIPLKFHGKIAFSVAMCKMVVKNKASLVLKGKRSRTGERICVSVEDFTKVYDMDSVRNGLFLHGKFVMIEDNSIFKSQTEKSFQVLYVTPVDSIPEYMMKGPGKYTVIPKGKNHESARFHLLLNRCLSRRLCIIAKRVYNKNNQPSYYVLVPDFKGRNFFIAVQLPYSHEVNFEWEEKNPEPTTSTDKEQLQKELVDYLNKININSPEYACYCPFTPNIVINQKDNKLINKSAEKYLKTELNLDQVDFQTIPSGIEKLGASLRQIWPSREKLQPPALTKPKEGEYKSGAVIKCSDKELDDFF